MYFYLTIQVENKLRNSTFIGSQTVDDLEQWLNTALLCFIFFWVHIFLSISIDQSIFSILFFLLDFKQIFFPTKINFLFLVLTICYSIFLWPFFLIYFYILLTFHVLTVLFFKEVNIFIFKISKTNRKLEIEVHKKI